MNCTEIHEGLPQKEIRDFLSLQMVKAYEIEFKNDREIVSHNDFNDTFDWAIADAKARIEHLKKYVENLKTKRAISKLIENSGWKEHDVSDDVYNNTDYRLSMNFIGTEEELEDLHYKIYPQDNK